MSKSIDYLFVFSTFEKKSISTSKLRFTSNSGKFEVLLMAIKIRKERERDRGNSVHGKNSSLCYPLAQLKTTDKKNICLPLCLSSLSLESVSSYSFSPSFYLFSHFSVFYPISTNYFMIFLFFTYFSVTIFSLFLLVFLSFCLSCCIFRNISLFLFLSSLCVFEVVDFVWEKTR